MKKILWTTLIVNVLNSNEMTINELENKFKSNKLYKNQNYSSSIQLIEKNNIKNKYDLYKIAFMYENGIGVKKDFQKAFEYYKKSDLMGNYFSTEKIALFYLNGIGTKINKKESFKYFKKSSEFLDSSKIYLGMFYENGIGTQIDETKALKLYKTVGENKNLFAIQLFSSLYSKRNLDNNFNLGEKDILNVWNRYKGTIIDK